MFDTSSAGTDQANHISTIDRKDRGHSKQDQESHSLPRGIVGVGVRQSSVDKLSYSDDFDSSGSDSDSESDEALEDVCIKNLFLGVYFCEEYTFSDKFLRKNFII